MRKIPRFPTIYLANNPRVYRDAQQKCNPAVKQWIGARRSRELYVSRVAFAEIRFGIGQIKDANRRHALNQWLDSDLRPWFRERVIEIDEAVILRWREMVEAGRKRGHTFSQPDLFIAASADLHGLCVATRNTADFVATGVAVVNPWTHGIQTGTTNPEENH